MFNYKYFNYAQIVEFLVCNINTSNRKSLPDLPNYLSKPNCF